LDVAKASGTFWHLGAFELLVPMFFIGLIIWVVGKKLASAPLTPQNNTFLKETIIHHT
jgi:hypothetical protein